MYYEVIDISALMVQNYELILQREKYYFTKLLVAFLGYGRRPMPEIVVRFTNIIEVLKS